jgi:hypothetical protein
MKKYLLKTLFIAIIILSYGLSATPIKANTLESGQIEEDIDTPNPGAGGDSIIELTPETFDSLNPLKISGSTAADELSTPGGIITRILNFLFPLAGLILFALISWGGFEIMISATDQKGLEAGKNRITAAIIGFILLFSSYWLTQIVEQIFGISIL